MKVGISRLCKNFFDVTTHEITAVEGIWVFIIGAENQWSLNHRKYDESNTLKVARINDDAVVYDFNGKETTPRNVFNNALKLMSDRGHMRVDHEDAGFFVPKKSFLDITNINDTNITYNDLRKY